MRIKHELSFHDVIDMVRYYYHVENKLDIVEWEFVDNYPASNIDLIVTVKT